MRTVAILLFALLPLTIGFLVVVYKAVVERLRPRSYRALKYQEERLTPPPWEVPVRRTNRWDNRENDSDEGPA